VDDKKEKRKAYRREWMRVWRENNKDKANEIRKNYWKKKLEREEAEKEENEDATKI
jgi:hypothetical protein